MKTALTIAGSDSGGGAGIQADLKTFSALGVYGMSVITSITAQNTMGVIAIEDISPEVVLKQIDAIFSDFKVDAVKIGMVSSKAIIQAIVAGLDRWGVQKIVLDPVMVSESGSHLLKEEARETLINDLIPRAELITPNLYEAAALLGKGLDSLKTVEDMEKAAQELYRYGAKSVLVKGGHLKGDAVDIFYNGIVLSAYQKHRIDTKNTHGTGCTYSSAIAAFLARGHEMTEAIKRAKEYVTGAIKNGLNIGKGPGPTHHFYQLWKKGV